MRCGTPLHDARLDLCVRCGTQEFLVTEILSLGPYNGAWGRLIRMLKFEGETALAPWLARRMAPLLDRETIDRLDAVTYVPMTRHDQRIRGFNQSALLARTVARCLRRPMVQLLIKTRATPPQSRLSAAQRRSNLQHAFEMRRRSRSVHRVLLVDDICTTGETIEACAHALARGGVRLTTALTAARA
jgi:competence protein ComFC